MATWGQERGKIETTTSHESVAENGFGLIKFELVSGAQGEHVG